MIFRIRVTCILSLLTLSCDGGFSPPAAELAGSISAVISYSGTWPSEETLLDLRFVAMRFVPADTADFLRLNQMEISETLDSYVLADSFVIMNVTPGPFFYSGIAQHFASDLLAWRPIGLYQENGGVFEVKPGATTRIELTVDFSNPPPFPPVMP